jgi:ABC-type Fe3+ transport system substrate-binding protein
MLSRSKAVSIAAGLASALALAATGAQGQEIKSTFDEIVAAAKEEPAVQWCTGMGPDESQPLVEAFAAAFPGVPEPNDFECSGEEATQRVMAEWAAGAPQADVVDADFETLEVMEKDNLTLLFDWSVFDGTPVEVDARYRKYNGRIIAVGGALRVIWYNPKILPLENAPKTMEECADPKYKGILAGDVRPVYFDFLQDAGGPWSEEDVVKFAKGIAANDPLWVRGSSQAFQVLSSGERGLICPQPLHGLFRGDRTDPSDPNAAVKFIIPKEVIGYEYLKLAFAPKPQAPNGTVLFAAWLGSNKGGQTAIATVNPAYSSPYLEGSFNHKVTQEAGAKILNAPMETAGSVAAKLNDLVLPAYGFPKAAN